MPPTVIDLIPVPVHGHTLFVADADKPLVPLRPICDALGLSWGTQFRKVQDHPTFAPTVVEMSTVGGDGKLRTMVAMPADMTMGWLLTIHPDKVAKRVRDALIAFQRDLYALAFAVWQSVRHGLPVHGGGRPATQDLFDLPNPMQWARHPTFQAAMVKWREAAAVENAARDKATELRKEARAQARRIGLSNKAFAVVRDWAALPAPDRQPALPFAEARGNA